MKDTKDKIVRDLLKEPPKDCPNGQVYAASEWVALRVRARRLVRKGGKRANSKV